MTSARSKGWPQSAAVLALVCVAGGAAAHDSRPLSLAIAEQTAGVYRVVLRVPPVLDATNVPRLHWPDDCSVGDDEPLALDVGSSALVACPGGLEGRTLAIEYPAFNPSLTTLARLESAAGVVTTAVLPPDQSTWTVPAAPTRGAVALGYTALGFEHISTGPDHLLFVAGLLLLAGRPKRILLAVTGFTAAHSVTLSLAALGVVSVPVAPVEALIALSIVFLAAEIARGDTTSFSRRYPVALSFAFGLLHGFGFASALGEIGLPAGEIALGLAFFNVGVELGQLAFIAAAALLLGAWRGTRRLSPAAQAPMLEHRAGVAAAYVLGVPGALWFFERTFAAFAAG